MNVMQSVAPTVSATEDDPLWYKDAVIYQVHVKSYFDSNNDGIGDFPGLTSRLDYIAALGVTAIWLLPFYPSPQLDDGYDIADYRGVHPDYGTLADVKRFIAAAHERGIKVITELVVNHTSNQHPWFQRARAAKPGSMYRDFYVWSDNDRKYAGTRVIFIDSEKSNWSWDETAQSYYWHRFYHHQPDLNFDNPRVMREILSVLRYWVDLGVDGLRLDAVPYLVEREGTSNENLPETHAVLRRIRSELDAHYAGKMLLAEANQWPEDTKDYFGTGDECHMAFNFPLMPRMYMAIAREDRFPITDILRQTPEIPPNCQWALFLRNHDELTLEMVTESERDFLWETYAADRRARLNLGIRRRLTPLLQHDRRRVELMNYLLLSMPGTPIIYYGDEIGMGDNIHLGDRNGVRTPMQWSPDRNGGFSRVNDPSRLTLPLVMDPLYAWQTVNVENQAADPYSLLMWTRRVIAVRRQYPLFGRGGYRLLYPANRKILAYLREDADTAILCVANLSRTPQAVELDLTEFAGRIPVELDGHSLFPAIGQLPYLLTLSPFGFYWFLLSKADDDNPYIQASGPEPLPEYQTVIMRRDLPDALSASKHVLERDILPQYLFKRRWFAAKNETLLSVAVVRMVPWHGTVVLEIEARTASAVSRWLLPVGVIWDDDPATPVQSQLVLARIRRGPRIGILTDGFTLPDFPQGFIDGLLAAATIRGDRGAIGFEPTPVMAGIDLPPNPAMRWISAEQSNSSVIVGDRLIVKMFRRVTDGIHPEAEMTGYLTRQGYPNIAALLGEAVLTDPDGERHIIGIAQTFLRNQGDAWEWTLESLLRGLSNITGNDDDTADHADYARFAAILGTRLGELHLVLARPSEQADFDPVTAEDAIADRLTDRIRAQVEDAYRVPGQGESADWHTLHAAKAALLDRIAAMRADLAGSTLTRIHGDLHLGQVLIMNGDVAFIDFEGEPAKPATVRRAKDHPLRDVAGMIRSFEYAAGAVEKRSQASHAHIGEQQVAAYLDSFASQATGAFLAGYQSAVASDGAKAPNESEQALLDLFLIEKAAYEVAYEAANRPTWIDLPVRALARRVRRLLGIEAIA